MAKSSKQKKPKTEKSLTTSKAFKGIENVIEKIVDKLPSNVTVDATKLVQMGLAGAATYVFAEDMVKQAMILSAEFGNILSESAEPPQWFLGAIIAGPVGAIIGKIISGETITDEEKIELDAYKLTEEQKMALACGVAALVPMTPEIIKGLGEVVKGVGEVVPG